MGSFRAGIYPPGDEDAREHDALATALPFIIQQNSAQPNVDLEKVFHILTQDPYAVQHHLAEAFLIRQFIEGNTYSCNKIIKTRLQLSRQN